MSTRWRAAAGAALVLSVLASSGCAGAPEAPVGPPSKTRSPRPASPATGPVVPVRASSPAATPPASPVRRPAAAPTAAAVVAPVGAAQWARIVAAGMAHTGCPARRTDLRRVEVNYWGFDDRVHRGVLVVNRDVATTTAAILTQLFDARFPIRRMRPLEDYAGDDNASMRADDTSAFNCRSATQANAPAARSPHANGRAIDINPLENPWRDPRCGCWSPSSLHATVRVGRGVIVAHGVVWTAFVRAGWIWQDIPTTDYMHFDTGYPSRPVRAST